MDCFFASLLATTTEDSTSLSSSSSSQIHFDYPLIRADLIERPFGEDRALMQHRHLDAERAYKGHVMLDDNDRMVARDLAQKVGRRRRLGVGHAGHRFVDEEKFRILSEQHAYFEPLLLTMRQRAGQSVAVLVKTGRLKNAVDAFCGALSFALE